MFFAAYTAPPQELTGNLAGTNGSPRVSLTASGEVLLLARARSPSMSMMEGAQLLARMTARPRARFGAASVLFGTTPTPTALLQVDNHLKATAPTPEALFWSGALLRVKTRAATMPMSEAPTSSAALLFVSAPTANLITQSVYQLNGTADLKGAGLEGLLAANDVNAMRGRSLPPIMSMQQQVVIQNYVGLMVGAAIQIGATGSPAMVLSDGLHVASDMQATWVQLLQDRLGITSTPIALLEALEQVGETLTFKDMIGIAYAMLVQESVSIGATPTASLRHALQLADALTLVSGAGSALDAQVAVATALVLDDALARVIPGTLTEDVALTAAAAATVRATLALLDAMRLQDAVTPGVVLLAQHADTVQFAGATASTATLTNLLAEGIELLGALTLDDGAYLAWVVNTETRAPVKYRNFPFNSFAKVGNRYFGAAQDGIYALEGDNDAGEPIAAVLRGGLADFGSSLLKRMPAAYVGYRADNTMVLKVTQFANDGTGETHREEHWYRMEARTGAIRENRVKLGRGLKSTYFGWELVNVDGADFALDTFAWYPLVLERRLN